MHNISGETTNWFSHLVYPVIRGYINKGSTVSHVLSFKYSTGSTNLASGSDFAEGSSRSSLQEWDAQLQLWCDQLILG